MFVIASACLGVRVPATVCVCMFGLQMYVDECMYVCVQLLVYGCMGVCVYDCVYACLVGSIDVNVYV